MPLIDLKKFFTANYTDAYIVAEKIYLQMKYSININIPKKKIPKEVDIYIIIRTEGAGEIEQREWIVEKVAIENPPSVQIINQKIEGKEKQELMQELIRMKVLN